MGFYIGGLSGGVGGASLGTITNHGLSLFTNNTDKVTILANGNVGIGTTSPGEKLDVQGNTGIGLQYSGSSASGSAIYPAADAGGIVYVTDSGITGTGVSHAFNTYNSGYGTRLAILANGNVGIGTTGPTAPLKVVGSNNPDGYSQILQVADSSDATKLVFVGYDSSNDYGILGAVDTGITFKALKIGPGNTYFTGNVGIGTTNPNTKLDVQGDIEISAANIQLRGRIGSNPSCASGEKEIYRKWTAESFSWGCYGASGGCSFPGGWGGPWSCSGAIYYPCDCPTGCTKHDNEFGVFCSCYSYRWTKVLCVGD
jgi:hypothetical protein